MGIRPSWQLFQQDLQIRIYPLALIELIGWREPTTDARRAACPFPVRALSASH